MNILMADDHVLFREGVARLLAVAPDVSMTGEADTVGEAVDLALKYQPDIVLSETRFADGDMIDLLETLLPLRPRTAVVALTGVEDEAVMLGAVRAGARGYLLKSIALKALVKALRGVMRGEPALSRSSMRTILDDFARVGYHCASTPARVGGLTLREHEVLALLASGHDNHELALKLSISKNTVRVHVRHILDKLHLKSRSEASDFARRVGLAL